MLVTPVLLNLPWLHSAFGPGSSMPDFWVRTASSGEQGRGAECWNVAGPSHFRYCEDIESIPGVTGTVVISCDANRHRWNTVMGPLVDAEPRGSLFTYTYPTSSSEKRAQAVPVELVRFPSSKTFHPLGMSILPHSSGQGALLFVVNHGRERSSVELFRLSAGEERWIAEWQRSIVHPLATHTPNSVHALTETSFVVTNDHLIARRPGPWDSHLMPLLRQLLFGDGGKEESGLKRWIVERMAKLLSRRGIAARLAQIETILGLSLGWVSHVQFDRHGVDSQGVTVNRIAKGIPFANGIVVTPDQRTMVVAATTYPGVFMYDLPTTLPFKRLGPTTKLHLPFRVDNLAWSHPPSHASSPNDRFNNLTLLATGHPAPFKLIATSHNPSLPSPSWSVAITPHPPSYTPTAWEDNDAPLPAHHFTLSHNLHWSIRTLLQTTGQQVTVQGEKAKMPSSASSFYHPHKATSGTLLVSGLYGPVLACTNVST